MVTVIELEHITKTYKVAKRNAGLKNALKNYFRREYTEIKALDDISFKINEGEMVRLYWTKWRTESLLQLKLCVEY